MLVGPSTGQLVVGVNQALSFSDPSQPMRGVVLTNQSVFEVEVLLSNGSDILQPGESNYYAFPAVTRATQVITITPLAAIPSVVAPSNLVNSVIIEASDEPGSYPVFNTSLASLLSGSQEVLLATVLAHASDTVTVDLQADMLSIIVIAPMSIAYQKISCTVQGVTTGVTYPAAVLLGHAYSDFGISVMAARIEPLVDDAVTVTWSGVPIHNWYVIGTTEELSPAIVSAGSQTLDGLADLTDPATVTLVGGKDSTGTAHVVTTDSSGNLVVDATFTPSGTQDVDIVAPVDGSGYVEVDVKAPNPLPVSVASLPTGDVAITSPVDGSGYVEVDVKTPTNFPVTQVTSPWVTSVSGSVAVTGTFWQATQPVSVSGTVAVTGTFWQATQPVSGTVTADQGTTPWTVAGTAAAGSPPSGDPVLIAGSDGTDVRTILTSATGQVEIAGSVTATNPSVSATGSAVPADATMVGGSDGTDLRALATDTSGRQEVVGAAAGGAAVAGNPVLVGGSDGTDARTLLTDKQGIPYAIPSAPNTAAGDHPPNELQYVSGVGVASGTTILAGAGAGKRYRMFFAYLDNTIAGDASRLQDGTSSTANFIIARGLGATQIPYLPSGLPLGTNTAITLQTSAGAADYVLVFTIETV